METKSRYEVTAELEQNKRNLIQGRDNLELEVRAKEKKIKDIQRQLEDAQEDWHYQKENIDAQREKFKALLDAVDDALKRMATGNNSQKK